MSASTPYRSPRSRLHWQVVIAGVGVLLVAGVLLQSAGAYDTVLVAASGGTYVEAVTGSPRYLNPVLSQGNRVDADISSLVFSGLTRLDECGNVLPDLAQSWEVSDDGLSYTFRLREDAFWHDGVPVVAGDVAFTIGVIQSPEFPGLPLLARLWSDVRVEVMSDRVVRFWLPEPYAPFLSYTNLGILPSHLLRGVPVAELTRVPFNRLPVGSGPFEVVESDLTHVLLVKNPDHYSQEHPYLDGIEFRFYRDLGEALRAHERGEVMGIADITPEYLPEVAANQSLSLYSAPLARLVLILVNLKSSGATYLGEESLRQALMYGLDRADLVNRVLEGHALVAHAPFSACSWALDPNGPTVGYDPQRARHLLDDLGWVDADGDGVREKEGRPLAVQLLVTDDRRAVAVAREVVRQWSAIGVESSVIPLPFNDLVDGYLQTHQFDCALVELSLGGDPDPYVLWHSSQLEEGGQNYSAFVNREADGLLEAARRNWDLAIRKELYHRFQAIFAQQLPALPLYYPVYTYAVDKEVRGVELGPMVEPSDRFRSISNWFVNYRKVLVRRSGLEVE
ncbi:MAG: peptide ABC transporter substrate-binding protein [Anaerolineae bacterium]|nr:peptide ABC transporter substrate-binding protein [Anaerolineae bacterium]